MSEKSCLAEAKKILQGKTIKRVRYMPKAQFNKMLWNSRPIELILDDDTLITIQSDDEGNDGGALYWNKTSGKQGAIPVM